MSGEYSKVEDYMSLFKSQKQQLNNDREAALQKAKEKKETKRRIRALRDPFPSVNHPKEWNPSINLSWFHEYDFEATEPNPDGKDFDFEGKSVWPVVKVCEARQKSNATPWYSVRSGRLFNDIPYHPAGINSMRTKSHKTNCEESKPRPWRTANCPPGQVFSKFIPDPSLSTAAKEKLTRIQMQEEAASREPWLPGNATLTLFSK